jgi:hypothetical protein
MKATKAVVAQRVDAVLRIRIDGAQFHDIVQYAAEQQWGVGERQLWNYVAAADALLVARQEKDRDKLFARHVAQRQALVARAVNAADYRTALAALKDEAELLGLYPPRKVAPTDPTGTKPASVFLTAEEMSDEELARIAGRGGGGAAEAAGGP